MNPSVRSVTGIPYGFLSAVAVTTALFLTLPLLTQFQKPLSGDSGIESVFIDSHKPAAPPPQERDWPEKQSFIEKKFVDKNPRAKQLRPDFDIPRVNGLIGDTGEIQIGITQNIDAITPMTELSYRPEEVDQRPTLLRSFSPQYPYLASRDNIEGWVTVRFVVGVDGCIGKAEVVAAEPEGIFEEAALKAIERYKFKPAIKNGETVNCIMKQRIRFYLD